MEATESRSIELPGWLNLRDVGGLPTRDGGVVRRGRLYRGEHPSIVATHPASAVQRLGLQSVVDLRLRREYAAACLPWQDFGVAYQRWPLSAGPVSSWHAAYDAFLTHRPETVVGAIRSLIPVGNQPALFYCAAGKDRTGVIAALLLSVLNVDDVDIVEDYLETGRNLDELLSRLVDSGAYAPASAEALAEQVPVADTMWHFLAWLRDNGGALTWLTSSGVSVDDLERFRLELLA